VPLILYLLRHGEAAPAESGGDRMRPLTSKGEHRVRSLALALAQRGWRLDRAFASPLLRARETARIVTTGAGIEVEIEELPELEPEDEPASVTDALTDLGATSGHVLLVGHMPQMARLARLLAGIDHGFAPAEMLGIECAEPGSDATGRLLWRLDGG